MKTLYICLAGLVCLSACGGKASYQPGHVDDALLDNFEAVAISLNEARGYEVIAINPTEWGTVVIDDALVAKLSAKHKATDGRGVLGYKSGVDIVLRGDMSEKLTSYVLAHELGHAMGLEHTADGLMAEVVDAGPDNPCMDDPGLCLSNSLDEAGL